MALPVAISTRCHDVIGAIFAAIAPWQQMLCCALKCSGLAPGHLRIFDPLNHVAEPHKAITVEATTPLRVERVKPRSLNFRVSHLHILC
jgi:hypothetical protein